MQPLIVPTLNSNDTDARLVEWRQPNGATVKTGETVATLETTKAAFELAAPAAGLLQHRATAGERYKFGATIGWVFASAGECENHPQQHEVSTPRTAGEYILSRAAEDLVNARGITPEQLRSVGKRVIKASDVERLVKVRSSDAALLQPSDLQQSIARLVSRSHATIPISFLVKKIRADAALLALAEFGRAEKLILGLPDLLVWITARLAPEFPFFFGALRDDLNFTPSQVGNIGVTFDLGSGLFVPVIRNAATASLLEIARQLMAFRMRALRGKFAVEDLQNGDLTISINTDVDTVLMLPIIAPPQTCMLSMAAVSPELTWNFEGQPVQQRCFHLGVAFDHRVINGFQANAFANTVKAQMEMPEPECWQ